MDMPTQAPEPVGDGATLGQLATTYDAAPVIRFSRLRDDYGCFSNFAPYPIEVDGQVWPTNEHYFQAQKFVGAPDEMAIKETIRLARSPMVAAHLGRSRQRPLRPDWEQVKDAVMLTAVRAKFRQYAELRALLLATYPAPLIEHRARDAYWGDGPDGRGKNRLGELLMQARDELRDEAPADVQAFGV